MHDSNVEGATGPRPTDPRRLVFVRKKWSGSTGWSDAIDLFYRGAAARFANATRVEISVKSAGARRLARRHLIEASNPGQDPRNLVVLINHSICWWALFPTLLVLKRRGATICLCMHEHEHILGLGFVWRHLASFHFKEILRYSRLYHYVPACLSSNLVVLTEAQASVLGIADAIRSSYLPVDGQLFAADIPPQRSSTGKLRVLFAHDPLRFDKGHRFLAPARSLAKSTTDVAYGRSVDVPFDQVYKKYWHCDVLFLPSDWESFSLVLVEALACNKFIVTNNRVGAVRLLLAKYSTDQLATFGLFVSNHAAPAYARSLDATADRLAQGDSPRTRALFDEFAFDSVHFPVELI